jgi:hypothetical protein
MDYSASINEADDPAGVSPWGNSPTSSPRANRPAFGSLGDQPAPPFNAQSSNGFEQEDTSQGEGFPRPGTGTTASGAEGDTEGSTTLSASSEAGQAAQESEPALPGPAIPAEGEGQPQQQEQQQAGHAQGPRRPAKPQFKLQAKVTGLERTGKKDPILRFDIHVRMPTRQRRELIELTAQDQSTSIPNYTIPRCPPTTLRVRQARGASDIGQPRSPRTRRPSPGDVCRCRDR